MYRFVKNTLDPAKMLVENSNFKFNYAKIFLKLRNREKNNKSTMNDDSGQASGLGPTWSIARRWSTCQCTRLVFMTVDGDDDKSQ
jgi:hypothetical protein